ncbi:DUF4157 domain-containing protein [Streptomyces sp. NPDC088864]|uniref:eCIS core domain-containing protein n=1 Tax=Streptomyces sp. NPDC088864 TaxID=3365910 RepID=UPI0037FD83BE
MLQQAGHPYAQPPGEHGHEQAAAAQAPAVQRSAVHDVLAGAGRPLHAPLREEMESRMGADFTDVRIHDGQAARASAAEIGALAYTSGNNIVIGDGGLDKHTLAHELTHVIQQRQGPVTGTDNGQGLKVSDPSDRFEREAESNARQVMRAATTLPAASAAAPTTSVESASAPGAGTVQRMNNGGAPGMGGFVPPSLTRQRTFDLSASQPTSDFLAHVPVLSPATGMVALQDVWTGQIVISNTDRPPTQYLGQGQQDHTVAWTLIRETLTSHSNKPAGNLVSYIAREIQKLENLPNDLFIQATQNAIPQYRATLAKARVLLDQILSNSAPMSEWGGALAQLIRLYAEAYQLNPTASTGGRSGGDSEGSRMAILRRQESLSAAARMAPDKLWEDVISRLYQEPRAQEHRQLSEEHLWTSLATAFPNVASHVSGLPQLAQYAAAFPVPDQTAQPGYSAAGNDALLAPLEFGVLDSGFVANVEVDTNDQGILGTTRVELSRRERPPTQFRPMQRSHTIAWKAIYEAAINATQQKSVRDVLEWVRRTLAFCATSGAPTARDDNQSWQALGQSLEAKLAACDAIVAEGQDLRPHFWAAMLSMLIRGCLTLENSSRMATGGGPADELGAAQGHAEGHTHRELVSGGYSGRRATELALGFLDTGALRTQAIHRVLESAPQQGRTTRRNLPTIGLLERSRSLNGEIEAPPVQGILQHWLDTTTQAYPNVQFEDQATMLERALALLRAPVDNVEGTELSTAEKSLFGLM